MTEIKVTVGSTKIVASVVQGMNGKTAYQSAVSGGYTGTEGQFNAILASIPTNASQLPFTPTGNISSTNVQTALAELDSEKASKTQEDWITPTLTGGATGTIQYRKTSTNRLEFKGSVTCLSGSSFMTLPATHRPITTHRFPIISFLSTDATLFKGNIQNSGLLYVLFPYGTYQTSWDGVSIPLD